MQLLHAPDRFTQWRLAARAQLRAGIPPEQARWPDDDAQSLFEPAGDIPTPVAPAPNADASTSARVPAAFLRSARRVAHHRGSEPFHLLYRILYRLTHGQRRLLELSVDEDVAALLRMEKAVRRDEHKMHAFVRFRRVVDEQGAEEYIAWHRPDHLIVPLAAPFFVRRFGQMRWTILTPDASARWDTHELTYHVGVPRSAAPSSDELEDLWLTYYGSIFNPARIKLKAMRKEMPVRHWATMPETKIIDDLLQDAPRRVDEMLKRQTTVPTTTSAAPFIPDSHDLTVLAKAAKSCQGCPLYAPATQTVFGEGPATASVMFVGEQPGDQEDLAGKPFVGPSGQLLDEVLREVGIPRREVYVTNAVKHFKFEPRGKRRIHSKPSSREVGACRPWLSTEISIVKPRLIVCLGATAAQSLLGPSFRVTQHRGEFLKSDWAPELLATVHPSSLLRIPEPDARAEARAEFANDLRLVSERLKKLSA